ncbi:MAG: inositol monophosphatase family protein [Desulfurococcaceae archaeon]
MDSCRVFRKIVEDAGNLLREYYGIDYYVEVVGKGAFGDVSRRIDLLVEDYIVDQVASAGFKAWVLAEERGLRKLVDKPEYVVVVDPLDGSLNYTLRIPFFAVSLAVYPAHVGDVTRALYGNLTGVFTGEVIEYCNERVYYNRVEVQSRLNKGLEVLSIYSEDPSVLQVVMEAFTRAGLKLKTRTMGAASLEASYAALGFIGQFAHLTGRVRNVDLAVALTIARVLGAYTYTQPPLSQISTTELQAIDKVVVASPQSPLLSVLDRI